MATTLTKALAREVHVSTRTTDGRFIATFAPEGIYMREKGKRTKYGPVSYGTVFMRGVEMAVAERRREKAEKRAQRKRGAR